MTMTRTHPSILAVLAVPALIMPIACTRPPTPESLEVKDQEQQWGPAYSAIPEETREPAAEPPPPPEPEGPVVRRAGQPWIHVGRYLRYDNEDRFDDERYTGDSARCPFETHASGVPAVTVEGDLVVSSATETLSASDGEDEHMRVTWRSVEHDSADHSVTIYDGDDEQFGEFESDDEGENGPTYRRHCRALWKHAKAQAEAANRRLAARTWRAMEPNVISIDDPDEGGSREAILATPAAKRPGELTYKGGHAVVRIPGVEVLSRSPAPGWTWPQRGEDYCDASPHIREVWGDKDTGAVAVVIDHDSGGCFCNSPTETRTLRWSEEIFEAAARPVQPREPVATPAP